ncbi:MAG: DUF5615 family PIN-like protein [Actinobacteria bacterium]|nr:DUF5615 family PIN-like protein [Actinomycetota bacterium]
MRFLVDENLPGRFVDFMRAAGHEASHVAEHDLLARPDEEVMAFARREGSVVVSYDCRPRHHRRARRRCSPEHRAFP